MANSIDGAGPFGKFSFSGASVSESGAMHTTPGVVRAGLQASVRLCCGHPRRRAMQARLAVCCFASPKQASGREVKRREHRGRMIDGRSGSIALVLCRLPAKPASTARGQRVRRRVVGDVRVRAEKGHRVPRIAAWPRPDRSTRMTPARERLSRPDRGMPSPARGPRPATRRWRSPPAWAPRRRGRRIPARRWPSHQARQALWGC